MCPLTLRAPPSVSRAQEVYRELVYYCLHRGSWRSSGGADASRGPSVTGVEEVVGLLREPPELPLLDLHPVHALLGGMAPRHVCAWAWAPGRPVARRRWRACRRLLGAAGEWTHKKPFRCGDPGALVLGGNARFSASCCGITRYVVQLCVWGIGPIVRRHEAGSPVETVCSTFTTEPLEFHRGNLRWVKGARSYAPAYAIAVRACADRASVSRPYYPDASRSSVGSARVKPKPFRLGELTGSH